MIFLLFFNIGRIYSSEYILADITVNGLSRTRYNTILSITNLEKGNIITKDTVGEVKQSLLEAGIFRNDIEVVLEELPDNEAKITITLYDRWTLIPLPVGFVSSDNWLAGAVFIQSNMAGLNQALMVGAFAGSDSLMGFAAWNNPAFLETDYTLGLSSSFSSGLLEHMDITGEEVLAFYDQTQFTSHIRVGRSLPSGFGWELSTGLKTLQVEKSGGYLENYDKVWSYWQNGLILSWNNLYYISFFNRGWSFRLKANALTTLPEAALGPGAELSISRSFILTDRHLLKIRFNTGWQDSSDLNPLFIGGSEGSRALPSGNVAVRNYASSMISFEPVIFKPSWGIFTFPFYYEAGGYTPLHEDDLILWHGPGIGFRFYLDKVAMPAMGANFTWDMERGLFKISASIGGSGGGH